MAWLVLVASGLLEAVWAVALGASNGFRRLVPVIVFAVAAVASLAGLAYAMKHLPPATAYAVWVGIGAVGAFLVSVLVERRPTSVGQLVAMTALVASIVAVKATAPH